MISATRTAPRLLSTGVAGLDDILHGGLSPGGLYAIEGDTGAGKTTLSLQFLMAGAIAGEPVMFVTLSESAADLRAMARSHGWDLEGIELLDLAAATASLSPDSDYTMFHPSEVELTETTRTILAAAERSKPTRIVLDSVGELRMLAQSPLRYRRQILALKNFFSQQQCTLLMVDDPRSSWSTTRVRNRPIWRLRASPPAS